MQPITLESVSSPAQLQRLLISLASDLTDARNQVSKLSSQSAQSTPPKLTLADLASIRAALQTGGSSPLNVSQLTGILAQSQRGFGVVAATLADLSSPALYEIGTFGIVTGPPAKIYYVAEGTPRAWVDTSISSGAPADMVTTDTVQTITAAKTLSALLSLGAGAAITGNVSIAGSITALTNLTMSGAIAAASAALTGALSSASLGVSGLASLAALVLGLETAGTNPYTITGAGVFIGKTVAGASTVKLPTSAGARQTGSIYVICDVAGNASTNTITVDGNGANIDGAATTTITTNYGVVRVVYTGSTWKTW